ncbi:hypothetical protein Tco_0757499 [Tanacetum coccineum]
MYISPLLSLEQHKFWFNNKYRSSKSNVDAVIQRINEEIKWKLMGLLVKKTIAVFGIRSVMLVPSRSVSKACMFSSKGNLQITTMENVPYGRFSALCRVSDLGESSRMSGIESDEILLGPLTVMAAGVMRIWYLMNIGELVFEYTLSQGCDRVTLCIARDMFVCYLRSRVDIG